MTTTAGMTVEVSALDISHATQEWGKPSADRSVGGNPLTLQGQVFAHGFGTHANGRLAIQLDGGARRFQATVGVDDEVGAGKGNVTFEVIGDGHRLFQSVELHSGDQPVPVDVDLSGVHQLLLDVSSGEKPFFFGHADWADARILYVGTSPVAVAYDPDAGGPPIPLGLTEPANPVVHPPSVEGVFTGTRFLWTIPVTGKRPLRFLATGLPAGLALDPATGTLSGAVAKAGDYPVSVRVTNAAGTATGTVHVVVGLQIALTPPLGWNSYDAYGDSVTEAEILANARVMKDHLQPYGWDTVVVDYRWYDPGAHDNNSNARAGATLAMDQYGRLLPAPNRFPSAADGRGFTSLAAQIHAMGLRFGIHIMRGMPQQAVAANCPIAGTPFHASDAADTSKEAGCVWCQDMFGVKGDTEAGRAYYRSLFQLYASWGLDFVKMDDTSKPYRTSEIDAVRSAIDGCGRSIVYSLSPGETPFDQAAHVAAHANQWRVSGDFWDNWGSLRHEFQLAGTWQSIPGPGHWPDADMLPLGHLSVGHRSVGNDRETHFTQEEELTMVSLWSLLPSPMMLGGVMPEYNAYTQGLLTNPEILAVNQDPLGRAAINLPGDPNTPIWSRELQDGSRAVGIFNLADDDEPVTFDPATLGMGSSVVVRDLWQRRPFALTGGKILVNVASHGAVMLRVSDGTLLH